MQTKCNGEELFKRNRIHGQDYLIEFEKNKTDITRLAEETYIVVKDLEIHFCEDNYSLELIQDLLTNISEIDNIVQEFCESYYMNSSIGAENCMVSPAWVEVLEENKVHIQYWGEIVNIELHTVFVRIDSKWINSYWCWC